jgi:hypothetical protein
MPARQTGSARRSTTRLAAAALFAVALAPSARSPGPSSTGPRRPTSTNDLARAIDLSVRYIENACGPSGKFVYRVDPNSGRLATSYNIVRHAGAIYALAMYNRSHTDAKTVGAMVRAVSFMRANYIAPEVRSRGLAVWSRAALRWASGKTEGAFWRAGVGGQGVASASYNPAGQLLSMTAAAPGISTVTCRGTSGYGGDRGRGRPTNASSEEVANIPGAGPPIS